MADDPWRRPDPNDPISSPSSAPGPYDPGAAHPYPASPPQRAAYRTLFWTVGTIGVLVLGGVGVGIWHSVRTVNQSETGSKTFLGDVRDRRFTAAYQLLCPSEQAKIGGARFASALQLAADRGHGVSSFGVLSADPSEPLGGTRTLRTAEGIVMFADGQPGGFTLELGDSDGHDCLLSGYEAFF